MCLRLIVSVRMLIVVVVTTTAAAAAAATVAGMNINGVDFEAELVMDLWSQPYLSRICQVNRGSSSLKSNWNHDKPIRGGSDYTARGTNILLKSNLK